METIKLIHHPDGRYDTAPFITEDEWLSILLKAEKAGKSGQVDALLWFFRMPEHKGTCLDVAKAYGTTHGSVRSLIIHFAQYVQKTLGNRFRVERSDSTGDTFWPIPMIGRELKKGFEWTVRPELVKAIRRFLLDKLLAEYRGPVISEGLDNSRSKELYKWKVLSDMSGKSKEEIVEFLVSNKCNFVEKQHFNATLDTLLKTEPGSVYRAFDTLLQDKPLNDRLADFYAAAKAITPQGMTSFGDERTATAFLACSDPLHYAPYMNMIYEAYCKYMGIPTRKAGQKYDHFLEILKSLIPLEQKDAELQEAIHRETDPFFWSDILNAQDILWQMRSYMLDRTNAKAPERFTWIPFYKELARKLLDYKDKRKELLAFIYDRIPEKYRTTFHDKDGDPNTDVDPYSVFALFNINRTDKNRIEICRLFKEGFAIEAQLPKDFTGIPIWNNWGTQLFGFRDDREDDDVDNIWALFEDTMSGRDWKPSFDVVGAQFKAGAMMVTSGMYWTLPEVFLPLDQNTVKYLKRFDVQVPIRDTRIDAAAYADICQQVRRLMESDVIPEKTFPELSDAAFYAAAETEELPNAMENTYYDRIVSTLKSNKNLILTGAPGTGKTFLAKQIACLMILGKKDFEELDEKEETFFNEHCKLVQFHPSYDYTDFVEGLRPVPIDMSQFGFQRENGVMKDLCEAALINLQEAAKSGSEQRKEQGDKARVLSFINDAIGDAQSFKTKTGKPFTIESVDNKAFYVLAEESSRGLIRVPLKDLYMLLDQKHLGKVTDIREIIGRKRTQQYDSYLFSIFDSINNASRSLAETEVPLAECISSVEKVKKENYVLIIDEINRGELSKIFGELFFAIEPGYRGPKGRVQTQYQNLVKEDDVFYEGFFVPENVYIIGTMNDIDRGVESMDFAIRRRFAWMEVNAEDRVEMLDEKIPEHSAAAKKCMEALNAALKQKEIGLTRAYDIGPAYFTKLQDYGGDFEKLWEYHIKGILTEYLRGTRGIDEKIATLKKAFDSYKE